MRLAELAFHGGVRLEGVGGHVTLAFDDRDCLYAVAFAGFGSPLQPQAKRWCPWSNPCVEGACWSSDRVFVGPANTDTQVNVGGEPGWSVGLQSRPAVAFTRLGSSGAVVASWEAKEESGRSYIATAVHWVDESGGFEWQYLPQWSTSDDPGDPVPRTGNEMFPTLAPGPGGEGMKLSFWDQENPDDTTFRLKQGYLTGAPLPPETGTPLFAPVPAYADPLPVCPSLSGYWGDYDGMVSFADGADTWFVRPFTDSTQGCMRRDGLRTLHQHVSVVRFR